ncbi:Ataxin-2, C-terminal [Dillenia turbinata]|uniref:Ataxin-2, C-terminal n=1 Tax=Dillenia turbinata TaxID=194707 RepID=A0AAN8UFX1_9MAGN
MNLQHAVQPRASTNGFSRRRIEREPVNRQESKSQHGRTSTGRSMSTGVTTGNKGGGYGSSSRDRLVCLTTCLIGHHVEVQVKSGSIFSGIFHAMNAEKDFGITLKMARIIKDCSLKGQKAESVSKAPSKTLTIAAKELVQVMAKGVCVTRDGLTNELQCEKQQDILIDAFISQSRQVDMERELERWVPEEDDPQWPELDNIFDGHWNRSWDQFETNEALFGVKSTFNEELYTTKLERGAHMRELEEEASRIAREIQGEETQDLHVAEERGVNLNDFDIDEETRFSSVLRSVNDSGYEDNEEIILDSHNTETFGIYSGRFLTEQNIGQINDGSQVLSSSSSLDDAQSSQCSTGRDLLRSNSNDCAKELSSELPPRGLMTVATESSCSIQDNQFIEDHGHKSSIKDFVEKQTSSGNARTSKSEVSSSAFLEAAMEHTNDQKILDSRIPSVVRGLFSHSGPTLLFDVDNQLSLNTKKDVSEKGLSAISYASNSSKGTEQITSPSELPEPAVTGKAPGSLQSNSRARPSSSASSTSDGVGATPTVAAPGLSPSSSVGSLSSEKSTLNPNAKEFKLNPNAKSFIPSQLSMRPASPVADGSFYLPANVPPIAHMHGMPMGVGIECGRSLTLFFQIAPSFVAPQPVMFNPQAPPMQSPQPYFHPNGPQYGQQMMLGHHPRQVLYLPGYHPPNTGLCYEIESLFTPMNRPDHWMGQGSVLSQFMGLRLTPDNFGSGKRGQTFIKPVFSSAWSDPWLFFKYWLCTCDTWARRESDLLTQNRDFWKRDSIKRLYF